MNIISNRAHYLAYTGALDLNTDVLKVALMSSSYTVDKDTSTFNNTYEITGTGYTAVGTDQTSTNGLFALRWNASGIMTLGQA